MQSLTVPEARNPGGRTATEVLAALQGVTGSRAFRFRYELLDQANRLVRELDNVESCTVTQNWLADIKRTATFHLRSGAGQINFLSDRIKPYVQLYVPPSGGGTGSYVEWPQGVFLLTSPARSADETGNIERDVQGYDQLQIYYDDVIADRYTVDEGELYTQAVLDLLASAELNVVMSDGWNRTISASGGWGTSSSGHVWTTSGSGFWTVADGYGTMVEITDFDGIFATVDVDLDNVEVLVRARLNLTDNPDAGVITRFTDGTHYYEFAIGSFSHTYSVWSRNGASYVELDSEPIDGGYAADEWHWIRVSNVGSLLRAKFWRDGDPEPSAWTFSLTDTTHTTGMCGLSHFGSSSVYWAQFEDLRVIDPVSAVDYVASDKTLPAAREWEPGTSKLRIINDLLGAINYQSLSFDEDGRAVVRPYVSPQDRSPEYTYADDEVSVIHPEATQSLDIFGVANRWVLVVSEPDQDPFSVTYTNNDPASPTSTIRRGRVITDFRTETEAADVGTLAEKVLRLAFEASQIFESIDFTTGLMPIHSGNDVYRLTFSPLAINGQYAELSWTMNLAAGVPMVHTARRVVQI